MLFTIASFGIVAALDCAQFDPKKIKLVTFDVFAALMDVRLSLSSAIAKAAPFLSQEEVENLQKNMIWGYGNYNNAKFTEAETGGDEPFMWVANTSLATIIPALGMQMQIPVYGSIYNEILAAWGQEIPWPGTVETINKVANKGYHVAPLSNGDRATLKNAFSVFSPAVRPYDIYSSDFPIGAFKPQPVMYEQLFTKSGFTRDEVLHVAGAPGDGQGAATANVYAALTWNQPVPGGAQPCFVLANITDLSNVLDL